MLQGVIVIAALLAQLDPSSYRCEEVRTSEAHRAHLARKKNNALQSILDFLSRHCKKIHGLYNLVSISHE